MKYARFVCWLAVFVFAFAVMAIAPAAAQSKSAQASHIQANQTTAPADA